MVNGTPVFVFNSLDVVRGGLTKAVLTRANELINHYENVIFLTLKFQPNFKEIKNELYKLKKLDSRVKVLNFFDDICDIKNSKSWLKKPELNVKEKGLVEFLDEANELPSYRYYQNGVYVKYKRFDRKNNLLFIDYMSEGRHRLRREEYNKQGHKVRVRHMDLVTNKPKLDRYFDAKGNCVLSVWIDENGKEKRTHYFKNNPKEYKNLFDLYTDWVEEKLASIKNPIVMSDSRRTDPIVVNLKNNNIKKIAILHNNHFSKPYDTTAKVKKSWEPLYKNIDSFDALVFLTNEQKKDFSDQFGVKSKYVVIPHFAKPVQLDNDIEYDPKVTVTLARYDAQKRLDQAIEAFSYVVQEIPDAKYLIYGFGNLEDQLNKQIKDMGLTNNVKLMGYAKDPVKVYQSAACSILTSDYEGFGLVLTESLAAGTPVVSYDIKYGPKDIIRDGIDGYLVPKGNPKELSNCIVKIMQNNELRDEMSKNALDVLNRFSEKNYRENWLDLLTDI